MTFFRFFTYSVLAIAAAVTVGEALLHVMTVAYG
jgi:hypothetical protein